jgi:hypothetical protein
MRRITLFLALSFASTSYAQVAGHDEHLLDDDPSVIVELGTATSWNTTGGTDSFQIVRANGRLWIASLLFDHERPGVTLSAKYLKTPNQ